MSSNDLVMVIGFTLKIKQHIKITLKISIWSKRTIKIVKQIK